MPQTTPTLNLCDQLVTTIAGAWSPEAPDSVSRVYDIPIRPKTLASLTGRQVYVVPLGYSVAPADRSRLRYTHRIGFVVVEKYPEDTDGLPLLDWADDRVDFVFANIVVGLDFAQNGPLVFGSPARKVWTETIEEVEVYDPDMLTSFALFWSQLELTFGEVI